MQTRSVVVKRAGHEREALSLLVKLHPTLAYGHKHRLVTKTIKSQIQAAEMSF